jgi:hypothetical protein
MVKFPKKKKKKKNSAVFAFLQHLLKAFLFNEANWSQWTKWYEQFCKEIKMKHWKVVVEKRLDFPPKIYLMPLYCKLVETFQVATAVYFGWWFTLQFLGGQAIGTVNPLASLYTWTDQEFTLSNRDRTRLNETSMIIIICWTWISYLEAILPTF